MADDKELYVNVYDKKFSRAGVWLHIFLGGRGTGKTYGALKGAWEKSEKDGEQFILLRRTDEERKLAELFNPYTQINAKEKTSAITKAIGKKVTGFYAGVPGEDGETEASGAPLGYMLALSTLGSIRGLGFDESRLKRLIYDEFIPEAHVRLLKLEGSAFLNAFETLNRNREFDGLPPIECYLLANSNDIYNPLFLTLGLVSIVEKMIRKGKKDFFDEERGLAIHLLENSKFSEKKKQTSIARLTEGSEFYGMAYENEFSYNDFSSIGHKDLKGYYPAYAVGEAHVWEKKGETRLYVSYKDGSFAYRYDPKSQPDEILGRSRHALRFKKLYASGAITFESYELKRVLLDFFAIK